MDRKALQVRDGAVVDEAAKGRLTYAELAQGEEAVKALARPIQADITLTPVRQWKVLGTSVPRPDGRELVTGEHRFPSDIVRPGMQYGVILRPPSYGAKLESADLAAARALPGVTVVRDGPLLGFVAPSRFQAEAAAGAVQHAVYQTQAAANVEQGAVRAPSETLPGDCRHCPREGAGPRRQGAPRKLRGGLYPARAAGDAGRRGRVGPRPADRVDRLAEPLRRPQRAGRRAGAFCGSRAGHRARDRRRVRRQAHGRGGGGSGPPGTRGRAPVALRWSREEEFTWAYFRPAAVVDVCGGLDASGKIVAWEFININSGGSGIEPPYEFTGQRARYVPADPPLRHGSYRALAATANNFARECFMDELAARRGGRSAGLPPAST